jgi:hypothetical protein
MAPCLRYAELAHPNCISRQPAPELSTLTGDRGAQQAARFNAGRLPLIPALYIEAGLDGELRRRPGPCSAQAHTVELRCCPAPTGQALVTRGSFPPTRLELAMKLLGHPHSRVRRGRKGSPMGCIRWLKSRWWTAVPVAVAMASAAAANSRSKRAIADARRSVGNSNGGGAIPARTGRSGLGSIPGQLGVRRDCVLSVPRYARSSRRASSARGPLAAVLRGSPNAQGRTALFCRSSRVTCESIDMGMSDS